MTISAGWCLKMLLGEWDNQPALAALITKGLTAV